MLLFPWMLSELLNVFMPFHYYFRFPVFSIFFISIKSHVQCIATFVNIKKRGGSVDYGKIMTAFQIWKSMYKVTRSQHVKYKWVETNVILKFVLNQSTHEIKVEEKETL